MTRRGYSLAWARATAEGGPVNVAAPMTDDGFDASILIATVTEACAMPYRHSRAQWRCVGRGRPTHCAAPIDLRPCEHGIRVMRRVLGMTMMTSRRRREPLSRSSPAERVAPTVEWV
jgi:hypothetical protein